MFTRILSEEQVKEFNKLLGINATKILISKKKKYYYATIVDTLTKIRISEELAYEFI